MTTPQVNTSSAQQNQLPQVSTDMGGNNRPSSQVQPTTQQNNAQNNWQLPTWNPSTQQPTQAAPGAQAPRSGAQNFYGATDPWSNNTSNDFYNRINNLLPVAQFDQNNMQYMQDFNESQRRWDAEFGATQGNNAFQQGLATRQQMSAEEQARLAQQNWSTQFGHTQQMDLAGLGLSQQQIDNTLRMGLDQNQATRDVAGIYAGSNQYQADQQLQGQLGSAQMYSDAQRYAAQLGLQEAQGYAAAQRYGAELGLQGQLGSAGMYSNAQMYGADQGLAGTRYQSDTERAIAQQQNQFLYQQLAQQAQQAQYERENQMRMASMAAYGRSQAPVANWSRSWG